MRATTTTTLPSCGVEIARGRACPGETIDDPAYNRPGRRGLAATCNDVIDFTVCSDGDAFYSSCLAWSIDPNAEFLAVSRIDDCCWRLSIDDSCDQLQKIATYAITATDTCNGGSDTVEITIGKVIVDIGDTTLQTHAESGLVYARSTSICRISLTKISAPARVRANSASGPAVMCTLRIV